MNAALPTILVVEDNEAIRLLIAAALEDDGSVVTASNAGEAIVLATERAGEFAIAICDVNLPGGSGPALIEQIAPTQPGLKTVFISGGRQSPDIDSGNPDVTFLPKPFRPSELRTAVRAMLDTTTD